MEYWADIGVTILIFIILGASLNLLLGYAGQISMAHAVFYGIGAYTAGLLSLPAFEGVAAAARGVTSGLGWHWVPALAVGIAVAFVLALVVALPAALRVRGEYLILLTLAFQIVANQLMSSLDNVTGGPYGLTPIPPIELFGQVLIDPQKMFLFLLVVTTIVLAIAWGLGESPYGRVLKGIREDEVAVAALGKNTVAVKVIIFGISAALAGAAGALAASYYQFIAPGNYSLDLSIFVVAVVVLGGAGNLTGTVVGAIVLGLLRPLLQEIVGDDAIAWQGVIYGLALSAMMYFRPRGLVPEGRGVTTLIGRGFTYIGAARAMALERRRQ